MASSALEPATSTALCWFEGRVLSISPSQGCDYTALSWGKSWWLRVRSEAALVSCMQDLWPETGTSNSLEGISKWQLHTVFEKKITSERFLFKDKLC